MDFAKLRRHVRQQFHARVGHEHIVFNPDAAPIWKICTRLNRKHHTGSTNSLRTSTSGRRRTIRGSSCTSIPKPWPVPCPNASPIPPSSSDRAPRHRSQTVIAPVRRRHGDRRGASARTASYTFANRGEARPMQTVRVRSTQYES